MKIAYYPGCSALGTSKEYEISTQAVCKHLGLSFEQMTDFNCCGSTPAHTMSHTLSSALSARNLRIAKELNTDLVLTSCPSCLANLKTAKHRMQNAEFKASVDELLDSPVAEKVEEIPDTLSVLQYLVETVGLDKIKEKVKKPLTGLKVACYYGCLLTRPKDIMQFDDMENPMSMDKIIEALGGEAVPFPLKTECCGAAHGIPRRAITANLTARILERAKEFQADLVAVACPLCHMNLDLRQQQAEKKSEVTSFALPVLYFTQLMAMAFDLKKEDIMLDKLVVNPQSVLSKLLIAENARKAKAESDKNTQGSVS